MRTLLILTFMCFMNDPVNEVKTAPKEFVLRVNGQVKAYLSKEQCDSYSITLAKGRSDLELESLKGLKLIELKTVNLSKATELEVSFKNLNFVYPTIKDVSIVDGSLYTIPVLDLDLIQVKAGRFLMGSPLDEARRDSDEHLHEVHLSKDFWIGRFEVTQDQYHMVMGFNPSYFKDGDFPVERVSWDDAVAFCEKLNQIEKSRLPNGYQYRLPSEAEWEYACRAGSTKPYLSGSVLKGTDANICRTQVRLISGESAPLGQSCKVGSFKANAWGVYDMHGNVMEWCLDNYAPYPHEYQIDPIATKGHLKVTRGGAWSYFPWNCRSSVRGLNPQGYKHITQGFRLVLGRSLGQEVD